MCHVDTGPPGISQGVHTHIIMHKYKTGVRLTDWKIQFSEDKRTTLPRSSGATKTNYRNSTSDLRVIEDGNYFKRSHGLSTSHVYLALLWWANAQISPYRSMPQCARPRLLCRTCGLHIYKHATLLKHRRLKALCPGTKIINSSINFTVMTKGVKRYSFISIFSVCLPFSQVDSLFMC